MYLTAQEKRQSRRRARRIRALKKIADGLEPECVICGCPHIENLQIGHPNGDGKSHRSLNGVKGSREMVGWVLRVDMDVIRGRVQVECPYCNAYHQKFGEYPPEEKRPIWKGEYVDSDD